MAEEIRQSISQETVDKFPFWFDEPFREASKKIKDSDLSAEGKRWAEDSLEALKELFKGRKREGKEYTFEQLLEVMNEHLASAVDTAAGQEKTDKFSQFMVGLAADLRLKLTNKFPKKLN